MTMDQLKTRDGDPVVVYVSIEGIGEYSDTAALESGQWYFSTGYPTNVENIGDGTWKLGYVVELPREWTAAYDVLGGAPTAASGRTLRLLLRDDLLEQFAFGRAASWVLGAELSAAGTTASYEGTAPTAGLVYYIDREAIFVVAVDSGAGTCTIVRNRLGTSATKHGQGAQAFLSSPSLIGRKAKIFAQASSLEVDRIQIGPDMLIKNWAYTGFGAEIEIELVSFDRIFARKAPTNLRTVRTTTLAPFATFAIQPGLLPYIDGVLGFKGDQWRLFYTNKDQSAVFEVSSPIIAGRTLNANNQTKTLRQGRKEIGAGELLTQVYLARRDFRFKLDGTETARNASGWEESTNGIDILLNLLTSSHDPRQDFVSTNGHPDYGNWACLPNGAGYGIPYTDIDFPSFLKVKREFPDYRFPDFMWGHERKKLATVVNDLLRPLRGYLIWGWDSTDEKFKLKCNVPRTPALNDTVRAVSLSDLTGRANERTHSMEPDFELRNDPGATFTRVTVVMPGEDEIEITVSDNTFGSREGSDAIAEVADAEIRVTLPFVGESIGSQIAQAEELALRLLQSKRSGTMIARMGAVLSLADIAPGDYLALTLDGAPDVSAGTRGFDSRLLQVRRADITLAPPKVQLEATVFGDRDRLGVIAPSLKVASSTDNTTYWTITLASNNEHTVNDAGSGLPANDVSAFRVGLDVKLLRANGESVTGVGTVLELGAPASIRITKGTMPQPVSGDVLILVPWDADLPDADRLIESYFSDETTLVLPDGDPPFVYGD